MDASDVAVVIPTRGDCDLTPILDSLIFDEIIIWNNSLGDDQGAYGRYKAIRRTERPFILTQDDDCVITREDQQRLLDSYQPDTISALMPPERVDYRDTVLIGWGALFDWHLPELAFRAWLNAGHETESREFKIVGCDFIFPMLTPWKRLDAYHRDLPHAHAPNRTWASFHNYGQVKEAFLRSAREIRDGRS